MLLISQLFSSKLASFSHFGLLVPMTCVIVLFQRLHCEVDYFGSLTARTYSHMPLVSLFPTGASVAPPTSSVHFMQLLKVPPLIIGSFFLFSFCHRQLQAYLKKVSLFKMTYYPRCLSRVSTPSSLS